MMWLNGRAYVYTVHEQCSVQVLAQTVGKQLFIKDEGRSSCTYPTGQEKGFTYKTSILALTCDYIIFQNGRCVCLYSVYSQEHQVPRLLSQHTD